MKKVLLAILAIVLLTSANYQPATPKSGGGWTFKTNKCKANSFIYHRESFTVTDTTQTPHPKFIIDFYRNPPTASGKYTMVRGQPMAADQVDIGVGFKEDDMLRFYSSSGANGKEIVTVVVTDGKINISGAGIVLVNQHDPKDQATVTFNITL